MNPALLPLALTLLWPQPRQMTVVPDTLLRLPVQIQAAPELKAHAALLQRELIALFGVGVVTSGKSGCALRLSLTPSQLRHDEEYALQPSAAGVTLRAHDVQGMFWAVHTLTVLLGQARVAPNGYWVTVPRLRDWPDTPNRAFMIQGAWTRSADEFKCNLELLARQHITYFALEFGAQVVLDFDPSIATGGRFTKAQAREIIDYGRSLGLKPIGYLNLLGHLDRAYQKAPYTTHGGIDIRSDETYDKFVYPILSEMLEVYGPIEYFHCGMDEAWDLSSWFSQSGYDVSGLVARHIQRVNTFLKARGVKLVIWHDMLIAPALAKQLGGQVGPANGGPPQNTAAALADIPRDVVLDYWFYNPLAQYPALDYLREQGFTVWASPWQSPFSFVRYAQARQAPTMGTLWSGPPGCFGSPNYSPVTALYAQAAWNAAIAPADVTPEPVVSPAAQRATSAMLWHRKHLLFPAKSALLLSTNGVTRRSWPAEGLEQHYGVPLDTSHPVSIASLPEMSRPLDKATEATSILLPGGAKLVLDGVNNPRGENQLVLYVAPRTHTGTNVYGVEVTVSATGTVLGLEGYGSSDHAVPIGGFVLSAHLGTRGAKANRLQQLRPGDRIAVLNAQDEWLAGYAPARLIAELPGERYLNITAEDAPRGDDQLVLYHPGYGNNSTGNDASGVEVVIRGGTVAAIHDKSADTAIPLDGWVLSAHDGQTGVNAAALRTLKVGDSVRLLIERGGQRHDLAETLAQRRVSYPLGTSCHTLYLAMTAENSSSPGKPLGMWVVHYADGTQATLPVRYGYEVLDGKVTTLPQRTGEPIWLVEQPSLRCLVREWLNPRPRVPIKELSFEPASPLLSIGAQIMGVTAAPAP